MNPCSGHVVVASGEPLPASEDPKGEESGLVAADKRPSLLESACSSAECHCTSVKNCALVISEDPLLRLSLLAMSLGISEVHTVVVRW